MRVGVSGTHGTGKTTLVEALCDHLPGHVAVDEPYYLLEEEGYEFASPPSLADYHAMLMGSVRSMVSWPLSRAVVFDRTPLDYLAYMTASGADPLGPAVAEALQPAFAGLDLLVVTRVTAETERVMPPAQLPALRLRVDDALLDLVYDDPLGLWGDIVVLELDGPLDSRVDMVLAALGQAESRPGRIM